MVAAETFGRKPGYVPELDLVRFATAVGVAVFHLMAEVSPLRGTVPAGVGVQIFFVVSGFFIANSAMFAAPGRFMVGRLVRLYPAAWICFLVGVAVLLLEPQGDWPISVHHPFHWRRVLGALTLIGPAFPAVSYWTLPVELMFYYIVWALMLTNRLRLDLLAVFLVVWSLPYAADLALVATGVRAWPMLHIGTDLSAVTLLRHGPYFALGILIRWSFCRRMSVLLWCAVALCGLFAALELWFRTQEVVTLFHPAFSQQTLWSYAVVSWGAVVALIWSVTRMSLQLSAVLTGALRRMGMMSYPIFLLHETVGGTILVRSLDAGFGGYAALAIAFGTVLLASFVVAVWLEPPAQRALRRLCDRLIAHGADFGYTSSGDSAVIRSAARL